MAGVSAAAERHDNFLMQESWSASTFLRVFNQRKSPSVPCEVRILHCHHRFGPKNDSAGAPQGESRFLREIPRLSGSPLKCVKYRYYD